MLYILRKRLSYRRSVWFVKWLINYHFPFKRPLQASMIYQEQWHGNLWSLEWKGTMPQSMVFHHRLPTWKLTTMTLIGNNCPLFVNFQNSFIKNNSNPTPHPQGPDRPSIHRTFMQKQKQLRSYFVIWILAFNQFCYQPFV